MAPQHEWLEKDYYKVLGVSKEATEKEITKAYRKLARQLHPDKNPGDEAAEARFKEVSAAYDVVGTPEKRKEYDEVRAMGPVGGFGGFGGGAPRGGGGAGRSFDMGDVGDLGDLLGSIFGGNSRAGTGRAAGPSRGQDLEAQLTLSFSDAVNGVTTSVHLTSDVPCTTCFGSGAAKGTQPETCTQCEGRGVLDDNQGMFSFSQPCPRCGGRGKVVTNPCLTCHATGLERKPRQVKVRVPSGVKQGQKIRLKGKGLPGKNGGPSGDLLVRINVGEHRMFGRKGNDLTLVLPVTLAEAALGASVSVPTLSGSTVKLKIPPGTRSGQTMRIKGRGIESSGGNGNLLVTVEVVVPTELSAEQTTAVEALAAAFPESPRDHLFLEEASP